jgi:predicted alpha/beta superfamily hydrolase
LAFDVLEFRDLSPRLYEKLEKRPERVPQGPPRYRVLRRSEHLPRHTAFAQTAPSLAVLSERESDGNARQFLVHSAIVDRDFVVMVSPPPIFASWVSEDMKAAGSRQKDQKLPAIYALDSGYGIAGPVAQMMVAVGTMSPAFVVSIGYPEGQVDSRRTDFLYRSVSDGGATFGGGGSRFQAFLTQELRPFLEAKYPLDPARAILFGHSFGGLFAAGVLAESPDAFDGYIIASASVWIDPRVLDKFAAAPGAKMHRVFVAAGEQEDRKMLDGVNQLAGKLVAAASSYQVEKKVFAHGDHISYYPLLVPEAFAWTLPPPGAGHTAITLPPEALQRILGDYQLVDGRVVTITLKASKTFVQVTGMPGQSELLPETPQRFFLPIGFNVVMTFEGAMDAPATAILVDMNGAVMRANRKAQ